MANEQTYYVKGMHCAACEILIEKKLLQIPGIKAVDASTAKGRVLVEYENNRPDLGAVNELFKKDNYTFFDTPVILKVKNDDKPLNKTLLAFTIAMGVILGFILLDSVGVSGFLNVGSESSLISFFGFGILAGLSSCAALVGGIILSMSKQWNGLYIDQHSFYKKFGPHALFNMGRIMSYALGGGLLGMLGSRLQISLGFISWLVIIISLGMIGLGLQMLEVRGFRKFQFSAPKCITRYIANEHNFKGKYMPCIMGALTFFLPCGFTITVQTIALLTGSALQGSLIMGFFALGTTPMLLLIGLSSTQFFSKPHLALTFSKVAGFLVIFFALFNIFNQMNVLGVGFWDLHPAPVSSVKNNAPLVDGKQVIKMTVYAARYSPNNLQVKVGIPVRWEITSSGQPGCDSGAVVSTLLPNGSVYLNPNRDQVTVAEFTPQRVGTYTFACPMGMVRGTIEVVN